MTDISVQTTSFQVEKRSWLLGPHGTEPGATPSITLDVLGEGVRLVNEGNVAHADGDGYYIRNGIIIVPKEGVIPDGTAV